MRMRKYDSVVLAVQIHSRGSNNNFLSHSNDVEEIERQTTVTTYELPDTALHIPTRYAHSSNHHIHLYRPENSEVTKATARLMTSLAIHSI